MKTLKPQKITISIIPREVQTLEGGCWRNAQALQHDGTAARSTRHSVAAAVVAVGWEVHIAEVGIGKSGCAVPAYCSLLGC